MPAILVLLVAIGFIATYGGWILGTLGAMVAMVVLWWLIIRLGRTLKTRDDKRAALTARAEAQHALILAGDDRGIYGDYAPTAL